MGRAARAKIVEPAPEQTPPGEVKKPRPLMEIVPELQNLIMAIEAAGGELDGPNGLALESWMSTLGDEIAVKMDGYLAIIRREEADAAVAKAWADKYGAEYDFNMQHQKIHLNVVKRLKEKLKEFMILTEQKEILTASGAKIKVQDNGGEDVLDPETLKLDDPELLPYLKKTVYIDQDAVLKAMKDGGKTFTTAAIKPKGTHIRVY